LSNFGKPGQSGARDFRRSGPQRHGNPRGPQPAEETVGNHWPNYLQDGYFDEQGHLKVEYVSRDKVEPLVRAMCQDRTGLTTHQVRRYFGHCRAIETRLRASRVAWASVWPDVKKLDIAAADGASKRPSKISAVFHDFIRCNVAAIRSEKDFLEGFLPHFEAVVGFGQAHFQRERT
jgi:CRISPR type III-A-associated protein Csm2